MSDNSKWSIRFLQMATLVSTFSKDPRCGVGAIVVNDRNQIISQGFNGLPRGALDDERLHDRDWKLKRIIHAEVSAILNANTSVEGCTIYTTRPPCLHCCSVIAQAGIKKVVFEEASPEFKKLWHFEESLAWLKELGVKAVGYRRTE